MIFPPNLGTPYLIVSRNPKLGLVAPELGN